MFANYSFLHYVYLCSILSVGISSLYVVYQNSGREQILYLDYGTVFIDSNTAFSYINGTVRIAYSVSNKKIYLGIKGVEQSPLIPKPMPWDSEMLYDFSKVSNILFNQSKKEGKDQTHTVSYPRKSITSISFLLTG